MDCYDCGKEACIQVQLIHGVKPFFCKTCFNKREKGKNWKLE